MEMKKFMNYEEDELKRFIKQDGSTIKIRFITESDYTTKVYYDESTRTGSEVFGSDMFSFRQSMIQYDPSRIFRRGETPVSASNHQYINRDNET